MKRICSLLIALVLLIALLPVNPALAGEEDCQHFLFTSRTSKKYRVLDAYSHQVETWEAYYCPYCEVFFWSLAYLVASEEQGHSFNSNGKCTQCGYQKTGSSSSCSHSNTKEVVGTKTYDIIWGNDRQHRVIANYSEVCTKCNKTISTEEKKQVAAHTFSGNTCTVCGYSKGGTANHKSGTYSALSSASVGDYITFGTYEQDNNASNGEENIEWLVLSKGDNCLLVISRYALDCKPYNLNNTSVTWETCTLRRWMNNGFLNAAFSSTEREMILPVTVSADKNFSYSTDPGEVTQDKVFLLSIADASWYFKTDSARECKATAYAIAQGAGATDYGNIRWWLRSPGYIQAYAAYVAEGGWISDYGDRVYFVRGAVRPAMWINIPE